MGTEIFYFSGSGNSLYITQYISEKIDAIITPIAKVINQTTIHLKKDMIGIVFPVYYGDAPNIVKRFVEKLVDLENKYIFLIANYGGGRGVSERNLKKAIEERGGKVSAQIGIHMPQNSFYKKHENHQELLLESKKRVDKIIPYIIHQKAFSDVRLYDILQIPAQYIIEGMTRKFLLKLLNETPEKTTEELIYLADKSYTTSDKCNGCGICSKVCPVKDIEIVENRPKWLNRCENCRCCYNSCPQHAIKSGLLKKDFYYRNPEINNKC